MSQKRATTREQALQGRHLKVTFRVHYITHHPEETLYWNEGDSSVEQATTALPMQRSGVYWVLERWLPIQEVVELEYHYTLRAGERLLRTEPISVGHSLRIALPLHQWRAEVQVEDYWIEPSPLHKYYTAPLAGLLGNEDRSKLRMPRIEQPRSTLLLIPYQQDWAGELMLVGSSARLGCWNPEQALPATPTRQGFAFYLEEEQGVEYKLILRYPDGTLQWEEGSNRIYMEPQGEQACLVANHPPRFPSAPLRETPQLRGTVAPFFALRTEHSYGVGDLADALELLQWMQSQGQSILQLLPFYDTTLTRGEQDSYPYSAVTTYGIHPIYMDVRQLPGYKSHPHRQVWERRAEVLNRKRSLQYQPTLQLKEEVMDACFELWYPNASEDRAFQEFVQAEEQQLLPYALFCTIRDRFPQSAVTSFPPYSDVLKEWQRGTTFMGSSIKKEVYKVFFRQYHLYKQLDQLRSVAHSKGIIIKGDLPIGAGRNSEDVWCYPHLFHLDKEAGSPPDIFSAEGQDWGFPTYNWEAMAEEGYRWWRQRLATMGRYMDAIRIDHILGFFRIWSIPAYTGKSALGYYVPAYGYHAEELGGIEIAMNRDPEGHYHPLLAPEHSPKWSGLSSDQQQRYYQIRDDYYHHQNEELWRQTAYHRLIPLMKASDMLICAEDLGVLTQSVTEVLQALEILSLEVVNMPKQFGTRFVRPEAVPPLSVLTTSTHDTHTLRYWWQEQPEWVLQELAELYHFTDDITPAGFIHALHRIHNILLILPLQDWFTLTGYGREVPPAEERINDPSNDHHIWQYRMPGTIAQLAASFL